MSCGYLPAGCGFGINASTVFYKDSLRSPKIPNMKNQILLVSFLLLGHYGFSQVAHKLWLNSAQGKDVTVFCDGNSQTLLMAKAELKHNWKGDPKEKVYLEIKKDTSLKSDGFSIHQNTIRANTDIGILYGVYELLRLQQMGSPLIEPVNNPSYERRILNHWDNLDGSVERGYSGNSIFWRGTDPFTVTKSDLKRWKQYGRANASVGLNGTVLNNVNASPKILTAAYLGRVKAIADVLRPYGMKVYLSVNFASPELLGHMSTADPLNNEVIGWWKNKVNEIYTLIPDFGGFLVKASSEGQPGPQDFGRTHADGANMLADALKPYGGILMWRAFVYSASETDRAKQAYTEFMPLDGKFHDNVIIQVKNGPIDFQPREPFSPLFGAMKHTSLMPELQITQEYLGHSNYLVFLSTLWEEVLKSDTYQQGPGSTVAKSTDGSLFNQKYTAIAGVSNIGLDRNWCGHIFGQANWYAFGRLAWNDTLSSKKIANEWLIQTFLAGSPQYNANMKAVKAWKRNFLLPVRKMMLESREATVNSMTPLGLHHIMSANGHYGPGPWWAPKSVRADWTPPYYHQAGKDGIGFDRTTTGSDAVAQYHAPLDSIFNNVATCPENLLLWFHHVPWTYKLQNGETIWDGICHHYDKGVKEVRDFQKIWQNMAGYVDAQRFKEVADKLQLQFEGAQLWKDACIQYFQTFSQMKFPSDIEKPVQDLKSIKANEFKVRIK